MKKKMNKAKKPDVVKTIKRVLKKHHLGDAQVWCGYVDDFGIYTYIVLKHGIPTIYYDEAQKELNEKKIWFRYIGLGENQIVLQAVTWKEVYSYDRSKIRRDFDFGGFI